MNTLFMNTLLNAITFDQVKRSYNGKAGCMCGCLGKWSCANIEDANALNKSHGYEAYTEENVSPRSVKIAMNKINSVLAMTDAERADNGIELYQENTDNYHYYSFESKGRTTAIYLL